MKTSNTICARRRTRYNASKHKTPNIMPLQRRYCVLVALPLPSASSGEINIHSANTEGCVAENRAQSLELSHSKTKSLIEQSPIPLQYLTGRQKGIYLHKTRVEGIINRTGARPSLQAKSSTGTPETMCICSSNVIPLLKKRRTLNPASSRTTLPSVRIKPCEERRQGHLHTFDHDNCLSNREGPLHHSTKNQTHLSNPKFPPTNTATPTCNTELTSNSQEIRSPSHCNTYPCNPGQRGTIGTAT